MKITLKKFLLFSFILLEFVSAMAFASASPVPVPVVPDASSLLRTKVSVSFIIARRRDCEGFGICNLEIAVSLERSNSCSGAMYLDDFNKSIMVLEIDKLRGVSAETYKKYFSSGTFLMEDDSPIPSEVMSSLGLIGSKTLVAGKHRVTERNGILFVSIPVK